MTNVSHPFRYHWERRALGTCRSGANDQHRQLQQAEAPRFQGLCPRSGEAPRRGSGGRGHEAGEAAETWELAKHGLFYGILWETPLKHDGTSWGLILQGGAPKIAKLVYNSNNYGLWYLQLYLLGFINQLITGGHHPVGNDKINMMIDSDLWLFSWETRWKHGDRP